MIPEVAPYNNYTGNSSTTQFDFDFYIENASQLVVQHTNSDGEITILTKDIDYSIHEIGNDNGSYIIFPLQTSSYSVLTNEEIISLSLTLPIAQESEYGTSSELDLKSLEYSFDYLTRICQIQNRLLERAAKMPEGSSVTDVSFPYPEANQVIQWDENGEKLINYDIDSKISNITGVANDAKTIAESAVSTSSTALTNANTAITKADSAISTANSADSKADNAVSTANNASTTATNAATTAGNAVTTANGAAETANSAKNKVDSFETDIQAVISAADKINQLQEAVTTATNAATTATNKASLASDKADEATTAATRAEAVIPSQTGKSGKFLKTNGTNTSWEDVIIPTNLSSFTDDLGSNPAHTHSQYETNISEKADISVETTQNIKRLSSGTIALENNKSIYSITPSGATTFSFNTSSLSHGSNQTITFELLVSMPDTAYSLTFPSNLTWQDNEAPDVSNTGDYFFVFRQKPSTGQTWQTPVTVGEDDWHALAFGNSKYVLFSESGDYVTYSTNGINWQTPIDVSSLGLMDVYSMTFGNGYFVAVDNSGYYTKSADGITWSERVKITTTSGLYSIIYANNLFVATGQRGTFVYSQDAQNWTEITGLGDDYTFQSLAYGNGLFVAVGYDTNNNGYVTKSSDGITWTTPSQVASNVLMSITYGNGKFVAITDNGYVTTSSDGSTWTTPSQAASESGYWESITYANGYFIASGGEMITEGYIMRSKDGTTWGNVIKVGTDVINELGFAAGNFFGAGDSGLVACSLADWYGNLQGKW